MSTLSRRAFLVSGTAAVGTAALVGVLPDTSFAGTTIYFNENGVALRGADPVAYFTEGKPVIGSDKFAHDWGGVTWHFASAQNRDMFIANPDDYAPQYGGHCAWAVGSKGYLASTVPEAWAIENGKLYLNYSKRIQRRWDRDRPGFIVQGDINWPRIKPM